MGGLLSYDPALPTKPAFANIVALDFAVRAPDPKKLESHNDQTSILILTVIPQQATSNLGCSFCLGSCNKEKIPTLMGTS